MANLISMSPEQMRTRAGEYTAQAENVQAVIDEMRRLLGLLQEEWKGDASEAYAQKYEELEPGFKEAKELIDDIAAALTKTAQLTEQLDSDIAGQFRS